MLVVVANASAMAAPASEDTQACLDFSHQNLAMIMRRPLYHGALHTLEQSHLFGDFSAVINRCEAALVQAPNDVELQLQHARALIAQTEFVAAVEALKPLVKTEQPTALRLYGDMRAQGYGGVWEWAEGQALVIKAAERGDPVAPLILAVWSVDNGEPEKEYRPWFLRAVATGSAPAEFEMQAMIALHKLSGFSQKQRLDLLQSAAAKGWPDAMFVLANLLRTTDLLPRDPARADALERAVIAAQPEIGFAPAVYYWEFG